MKYSRVVVMVGHGPDAENWDCGCDQTFSPEITGLHQPEKNQYVIGHDRGFISPEDIEKLKTATFTEEGGI